MQIKKTLKTDKEINCIWTFIKSSPRGVISANMATPDTVSSKGPV